MVNLKRLPAPDHPATALHRAATGHGRDGNVRRRPRAVREPPRCVRVRADGTTSKSPLDSSSANSDRCGERRCRAWVISSISDSTALEIADRRRNLGRRPASTDKGGHRHEPLVPGRARVGQPDDGGAPCLLVARLACRVGHHDRRDADVGAQRERGQHHEVKSGDARLDLLVRWGREACKEREVAHQPGVEADPVAPVREFAPQSRGPQEALMACGQIGCRAHRRGKLGATAHADRECAVQRRHQLENSAGVVGEAKLRRKALPESSRAHGGGLLRELPEQLDSTLRDTAQGSVSDPNPARDDPAKRMQERQRGRSRSALRGVACSQNGDRKLKLNQ